MLSERLRLAREACGLSTRDVAIKCVACGISASHATIGNYELGRSTPSADVIEALAKTYKRSVASLIRDFGLLKGIRYRCLKSVGAGERRRYEAIGQSWLEAYLTLEDLLNDRLDGVRHANFKVARDDGGRQVAERIRKDYQFNIYPVPSAIRLVENFGIRVIQLPTEARIDAFAGWLGDCRVVVVNSNLPNDRIRLTILHELAHHLYEDCLESGRALADEDIESRAFEFSSHLLMPDDQLRAAIEHKSMVSLVQYKERFGISLAAMIYRAGKDKLISKRLYERIWRDFSRLGLQKNEPGYVAPDRPLRFESLIDSAIGQNLATFEQIASWVGTSADEVRSRVRAAMGSAEPEEAKETDAGSGNYRLADYMG